LTGTGDFDISSTDTGLPKVIVVDIIEIIPEIIKNHDMTVIDVGRFTISPQRFTIGNKTLAIEHIIMVVHV
jgi:hypothetical protein